MLANRVILPPGHGPGEWDERTLAEETVVIVVVHKRDPLML